MVRKHVQSVALYPLSSPNHNSSVSQGSGQAVALYPLSSPNHNLFVVFVVLLVLRYILFHHQTTTIPRYTGHKVSCVISSFITKPQPRGRTSPACCVALYPLSSPNHNHRQVAHGEVVLRYILFHHQTTTVSMLMSPSPALRYILFHHQTTTIPRYVRLDG